MFDNKPASLLSLCFLVWVTEGQRTITAEPGQNVTLPGRAPNSTKIRVIEWTRSGLEPKYVFVYRNKKFDPTNQHPSFKERVELKDSQMKDGDVSVTLKNVTFTDNGTYECHVAQGQTDPLKPINITHLRVSAGHREDGGDQDGGDMDGGDTDGGDIDGGDTDGGDMDGGDTDGGDKDGGDKGGQVGLILGLTVVGILLLVAAAVGFMFYRKRCRPTDQNPNPPPEQTPMNPK